MPGNKSFCLAYPSSGLLLITLIALILPSPITPSLDICNTVFSKVSLLINLILEGSMYSIKKIWSFNISLVGSEIKIISPNFNNISSGFFTIMASSFKFSSSNSPSSNSPSSNSTLPTSLIIGSSFNSLFETILLSSLSFFSSSKLIFCDILYLYIEIFYISLIHKLIF